MVGFPLVLGARRSQHQVFCQIEGSALRISANEFREELGKSEPLNTLCLRYSLAMLNQFSQAVACANQHRVEQRFARWLLATQDRVGTEEIALTQEFLALMLGVRRASITEAARGLQESGIISYRRGHITIHDRTRLEATACECYRVIRDELDRVTS